MNFVGTRKENCKLIDEDVNAKVPVEDTVYMRVFAMAAVESAFFHLNTQIWGLMRVAILLYKFDIMMYSRTDVNW